ncbi:MAG: M23 family metallopeptidase [Alphaproteobacteria bacterium]
MQIMKLDALFFFAIFATALMSNAYGKSLLSAQSFPKTFNDLSFIDRMNVIAEGYEPYESEYVAGPNGKMICVKGCAYQGMSIEDHLDDIKHTTQQAINVANEYLAQNQPIYNHPTQPNNGSDIVGQINEFLDQNNSIPCAERNPDIPTNQEIPYGEPVANKPRISSPFGERTHPIRHTQHVHEGIDYAVPTGTHVYTTANGTVTKVWKDNSCGNGLKIKYATGISAIYCHLDHALVKEGDYVRAGCTVAISDNSGASTGAHLHYGMKDANDKPMDPSPFTGRAK